VFFKDRKSFLLFILWGFFVTNAMVAEMIGVKLIDIGASWNPSIFIMSVGIIPWPIVFLSTDIINEFYGKEVVQKLSVITAFLIAYAFVIIYFSLQIPAFQFAGVQDDVFNQVFGQSMWIIVGSISAFLTAQMIDVLVFWFFKNRTGGKMIWLRATGSTAVSQLVDTFIVLGIAFWLPGKISTDQFIKAAFTGYSVKLMIAILLTPLIYLGHSLVKKYLKIS
jgi:uncharacterized integral membrane protein (TIGR00697 family)